jgi:hypothetical protein
MGTLLASYFSYTVIFILQMKLTLMSFENQQQHQQQWQQQQQQHPAPKKGRLNSKWTLFGQNFSLLFPNGEFFFKTRTSIFILFLFLAPIFNCPGNMIQTNLFTLKDKTWKKYGIATFGCLR